MSVKRKMLSGTFDHTNFIPDSIFFFYGKLLYLSFCIHTIPV